MEKKTITLTLSQMTPEEMSEIDRKLIGAANNAAENAYAPYSDFSVGAAVLLENGEIISASNQENAAYPSGLCAERVALFYAGAKFPGVKILKLFITVQSPIKNGHTVYAPCGACRQVISESQNRQDAPIQITFEGPGESFTRSESIEEIMPFTFRLKR
jgi:cytidine deaminase